MTPTPPPSTQPGWDGAVWGWALADDAPPLPPGHKPDRYQDQMS